MTDHWQSLVADLAVVALFISAWVHGHFVLAEWPRWARDLAFGMLMGLGAVASMMLSIQLQPGVLLDLRMSVIALASFFGGPVAAVTVSLIAVAYRLSLGGAGAIAGSIGIVAMAVTALVVSRVTYKRVPALVSVAILAASIVAVNFAVLAGFLAIGRRRR